MTDKIRGRLDELRSEDSLDETAQSKDGDKLICCPSALLKSVVGHARLLQVGVPHAQAVDVMH